MIHISTILAQRIEHYNMKGIKIRKSVAVKRKCIDCPALIKGSNAKRCKPCQADEIDRQLKNRALKK